MPQSKQQEDKNDSQAVLASPIFPFPFRVVNYVSQQNESSNKMKVFFSPLLPSSVVLLIVSKNILIS
jgi:hypothetical protein